MNRFILCTLICLLGIPDMSAALPERTPENVARYKEICRKNIYPLMKAMNREPVGALKYPFIVPGSGPYVNDLWDWDSWLSNVAIRQIVTDKGNKADAQEAFRFEQGCILNKLSYCGVDGYVPVVIQPGTPSPADLRRMVNIYRTNMHKPCLAQQAAFIIQQNDGDARWLRDSYFMLAEFVNKYLNYHRDKSTGLLYWEDDERIGVDNDPSTFYRPHESSGSIFLNSFMYKELKAMAYISQQLGMSENATDYDNKAQRLAESINRYCWDPRDGTYYSVDFNLLPVEKPGNSDFSLHQGAPRDYDCLIQRFSVWSSFLPMWAGIASPEQAKEMVERNYRNPKLFNAPAGVYTLSPMEKMYNVKASGNPSSWLGPVWGCANYFVWKALLNYGYEDDARELAEKTVILFGYDFERFGLLHEYYGPESGEPILNPGFQDWNLLVLNMIAWLDGRQTVSEF